MNPSHRLESETIDEYLIRLGTNMELYSLTWSDIAKLMNVENEEEYNESKYRKDYASYKRWKPFILDKFAENEMVNEVRDATVEYKKERIKLQTEKIEMNKLIREEARAELLEEKIIDAVINRPTINIPNINLNHQSTKEDFVFPIADIHDGVQFVLKGWDGETLNEYSPDIMEKRMWSLLEQFIRVNDERKINHVHVPNLGDSIDGILRMSQLMSLKLGVVDSSIHFAEFMSQWLNELSKYVTVDYYSIFGNHDQMRILSGKRDEFPHENAQKWITKLIEANLKNNDRVNIYNKQEFMYIDVLGTKICGIHGENDKNLEKSIKDYSMVYNKRIDTILSGHYHHSHEKTIGFNGVRDIEFIQCPSVIGIDDYSLKLKKTSTAGAKLLVIQEDVGRSITYNFKV